MNFICILKDCFLFRYKDGNDSIGEHRDDEKDLVADSPIASLSLGQKRDFVFKHAQVFSNNYVVRDEMFLFYQRCHF